MSFQAKRYCQIAQSSSVHLIDLVVPQGEGELLAMRKAANERLCSIRPDAVLVQSETHQLGIAPDIPETQHISTLVKHNWHRVSHQLGLDER